MMIVYEENTKRIVIPSGLGNLTGLMEAEAQAMYNSGRTDGYNEGVEDGKSMQDRKLTDSVTFNENGEYDADYGYKKVIVDVDKQWDEGFEVGYESGNTDGYASGYTEGYTSGYTDGYTSGYTDGYASATSRLVTFRFESYRVLAGGGPSGIIVNGVPSEYFEHTDWYQGNPSFIEISAHTGDNIILSAELVINLLGPYESIWPQEWDAVYVNGNKTEPISQTKNVDGDYLIYNFTFYPCGSSSAITDAYESGYTDGYASGYTNGYASGYSAGQADCEGGCDDYLECRTTVFFAEDTVIPAPSVGVSNYIFFNLDMAYTYVYGAEGWVHNGESLHYIVFNEVTLPAGTYEFKSILKQNGEWYTSESGSLVIVPNDTIPGGGIGSRFYFNENKQ